MKSTWLAVLLLTSCGDGETPNDLGTCGAWPALGSDPADWKCERACAEQPANHDGSGQEMPCSASHGSIMFACERTFPFDGERGCCISQVTPERSNEIQFFACD